MLSRGFQGDFRLPASHDTFIVIRYFCYHDELKRNYPDLSTAYYFCYHTYEIRAFIVSASVQSLPQHSIINSKKVSLLTIQ